MHILLAPLLISLSLFSACQSAPKKQISSNAELGTWAVDPTNDSKEIILIPQWHLAPQVNTVNLKSELPQYQNQRAIYRQVSDWIRNGNIQSIVVEGCEKNLDTDSALGFNGWTLQMLKTQKREDAQTHIGLKLLAYSDGAAIECGDDLKLIKENQLALSDIRGLYGFKSRIEQKTINPKTRRQYLEGAISALKLPKSSSDSFVLAQLKNSLSQSIKKFESLISQRNESFLRKLDSTNGRKVVVIGAIHIEDLKRKLIDKKASFSIWRPVGLDKEDENFIDRLKTSLK